MLDRHAMHPPHAGPTRHASSTCWTNTPCIPRVLEDAHAALESVGKDKARGRRAGRRNNAGNLQGLRALSLYGGTTASCGPSGRNTGCPSGAAPLCGLSGRNASCSSGVAPFQHVSQGCSKLNEPYSSPTDSPTDGLTDSPTALSLKDRSDVAQL
eukprot:365315-Chlamydomonas_euryale.AAC.1